MKKKYFVVIIFLGIIFLTGCLKKNEQLMDVSAEDGNYYYRNKDLGFNLVLPKEFIYYQTQRQKAEDFIDLEVLIPTSDQVIIQDVPGYLKPIVIRVFDKEFWEENLGENKFINLYTKLDESRTRVYGIKFWEQIPSDWSEKWSEDIKEFIINNFELR